MTDQNTTTPIDPALLPEAITTYLSTHEVRDTEGSLRCFTGDATVTDEGHDHTGPDAIREWLDKAASEYTYTTTLTAAGRIDVDRFVATHHLEGDFPGGVVDLHFRFTLRDGLIERLVIEP